MTGDADIRLEDVTKRFAEMTAVDDLTLSIPRGAFYALLGPSGCGKTTTLRMIGGFEEPDAGTIEVGGKPVTGVPPYKREVNTVFQSYALFEHLVDRLALEEDAPLARLLEARDHPQGRRLAAARRAEQREERAGLDLSLIHI